MNAFLASFSTADARVGDVAAVADALEDPDRTGDERTDDRGRQHYPQRIGERTWAGSAFWFGLGVVVRPSSGLSPELSAGLSPELLFELSPEYLFRAVARGWGILGNLCVTQACGTHRRQRQHRGLGTVVGGDPSSVSASPGSSRVRVCLAQVCLAPSVSPGSVSPRLSRPRRPCPG